MNVTGWLLHTCTIQTPSEGAQDAATGHPAITWASTTGVACRCWQTNAGKESQDGNAVMVADYRMIVAGSTTVSERSRITAVKDANGNALTGQTNDVFEVTSVAPWSNGRVTVGKELYLKLVR